MGKLSLCADRAGSRFGNLFFAVGMGVLCGSGLLVLGPWRRHPYGRGCLGALPAAQVAYKRTSQAMGCSSHNVVDVIVRLASSGSRHTYALEEPRCDQQAQEEHACHDGIPCESQDTISSSASTA